MEMKQLFIPQSNVTIIADLFQSIKPNLYIGIYLSMNCAVKVFKHMRDFCGYEEMH